MPVPAVDPEFAALIPLLTPEERVGLESSLVAQGCRDAVVVWAKHGILLDGHNRKEICERHGIPFRTIELHFASRTDAKIWVIENQFSRRNLIMFQRAELALKLEPLIKEKAKQRQSEAGKKNQKEVHVESKPNKSEGLTNSAKAQTFPVNKQNPPISARQEVAKIAHVSEDTIFKVKKILQVAPEGTKQALRNDEISVNHAYTRVAAPVTAPHVSYNSGENEWYTPAEYIESARSVLGGIDLDPASSAIANKTVKATKFFTKENSGLNQKWEGRVYLNPPYESKLIKQFATKFAGHAAKGEIKTGIVLTNNSTETEWFRELVDCSNAIVFPSGRVKFLDPRGNPGAPLQGQAIFYVGNNPKKFLTEFRKFGWGAEL